MPDTVVGDAGPAFLGDPRYFYVGKLVHELTLEQIHSLDCGKGSNEFSQTRRSSAQE